MIKVLKLVTSEEIVGDVEQREDGKYVVNRPYAIMLISDRSIPEQHSMALIPYCSYVYKHFIEIDPNRIVWMQDLEPTIRQQYEELVSSTIEIIGGETKAVTNFGVGIETNTV